MERETGKGERNSKMGWNIKKMDDMGGGRGESRCDMLPKIEKSIMYKLKINRQKKKCVD